MHIHTERCLRSAIAADLVELDRLIGILQHVRGLDAEAIDQRVAYRLDALVEHGKIGARYVGTETNFAARERRDRREVARILDGGIQCECAEPDVVAADREQHEVDRPLAAPWRAPLLRDGLRRNSGAAIFVD